MNALMKHSFTHSNITICVKTDLQIWQEFVAILKPYYLYYIVQWMDAYSAWLFKESN